MDDSNDRPPTEPDFPVAWFAPSTEELHAAWDDLTLPDEFDEQRTALASSVRERFDVPHATTAGPDDLLVALAVVASHRLRYFEGTRVCCETIANTHDGHESWRHAWIVVVRLPSTEAGLRLLIWAWDDSGARWTVEFDRRQLIAMKLG